MHSSIFIWTVRHFKLIHQQPGVLMLAHACSYLSAIIATGTSPGPEPRSSPQVSIIRSRSAEMWSSREGHRQLRSPSTCDVGLTGPLVACGLCLLRRATSAGVRPRAPGLTVTTRIRISRLTRVGKPVGDSDAEA